MICIVGDDKRDLVIGWFYMVYGDVVNNCVENSFCESDCGLYIEVVVSFDIFKRYCDLFVFFGN